MPGRESPCSILTKGNGCPLIEKYRQICTELCQNLGKEPLAPEEAKSKLPNFVISAVNELICKRLEGDTAEIWKPDLDFLIEEKYNNIIRYEHSSSDFFDRYVGCDSREDAIIRVYKNKGWDVVKKGGSIIFSKQKKAE